MEAPLEDLAVRTDEHKGRNTLYTVDVSRNLTAVVDMEPVHSKLCSSLYSVRLRRSLPYSKDENLKTLVLVLLVHSLDIRNLPLAWSAPW